jgi:hypothetical protein
MHTDPRAIEQLLLSEKRQPLLVEMVGALKNEAVRILDQQEQSSTGLRRAAVKDVRDDVKTAFLNLELLGQRQPSALTTALQDQAALKAYGFTAAQTYVLMRAAQDIMADDAVSGRPVKLLKSAIVREVNRQENWLMDQPVAAVPAAPIEVAATTLVPEVAAPLLLLAAPTEARAQQKPVLLNLDTLLRPAFDKALLPNVNTYHSPSVPAKAANIAPARHELPTLSEELGIAPVLGQAVSQNRLGMLANGISRLQATLAEEFVQGLRKGQKIETVDAPLRKAFAALDSTSDLASTVQDVTKLEKLGFTHAQADRLARSAEKLLTGEEESFNTTRFMSAVRLDLAKANPVILSSPQPFVVEGPDYEPKRVSTLLKSLVKTMRGALTGATAATLDVKTQVEQSFGTLLRITEMGEPGFYGRLAAILRRESKLEEAGFTPAQSDAIASSSRAYLDMPGTEPNTASFGAVLRSEVIAGDLQKSLTSSTQSRFMQRLRGVGERIKNSGVMERALAGSALAVLAGLVVVSNTVPAFLKDSAELAKAAPAPVAVAATQEKAATPAQAAVVQAPRPTTAVGALIATVGTPVAAAEPVVLAPAAQATPPVAAPPLQKAELKAAAPVLSVKPAASAKAVAKPTQAAKVVFNQQIAQIQGQLLELGDAYKALQKDGITGQPTQQFKNAVTFFQYRQGLKATGSPNPQTLEKLASLKAPALTAGL